MAVAAAVASTCAASGALGVATVMVSAAFSVDEMSWSWSLLTDVLERNEVEGFEIGRRSGVEVMADVLWRS